MRSRKDNSVTIKDVAERAGVSSSTVSRFLNNPDIVDAETLDRVNEAIIALGYKTTKKKVVQKKSESWKKIAILIPDILNPQFHQFIKEIRYNIRHEHMIDDIFIFDNNPERIEKISEQILDDDFDGCIVICLKAEDNMTVFHKLIETIPTVGFQSDVDGIDMINTTDGEGTFETLEKLYEWGHRKIGFIGYSKNLSLTERRFEKYKEFLEKHNIEYRREYVVFGLATLESGYDQACRLLSLVDRPTAIHCFNCFTAMGVYIAAREMGIKIPEDISITAFDDPSIAMTLTPTLTTVAQPAEAIGRTLTNMLIERIKGSAIATQSIVFPTNLMIRESAKIMINK